jgi:hypothetical protein
MYLLNTTRNLQTPATPETLARLVKMLESEVAPSVASVEGLQSISWMLSSDRQTLQAFSGWGTAEGPAAAERHPLHQSNSVLINDMLGGLVQPQQHTYYELLVERSLL